MSEKIMRCSHSDPLCDDCMKLLYADSSDQTDDWLDELLNQMGYTQNKDSRRLARRLIEAKLAQQERYIAAKYAVVSRRFEKLHQAEVIRGRMDELANVESKLTTSDWSCLYNRISKLEAELAEIEK